MESTICPDTNAGVQAASQIITQQLCSRPACVLGLATGDTSALLYKYLVRMSMAGELNFSQAFTFAVDEYVGLPPGYPASCQARLNEQLYQHLSIPADHIHSPDVYAVDLEHACCEYEDHLASHGGIDLLILGIGLNGHLGFNEPSGPLDSRTHLAQLSSQSLKTRASIFAELGKIPTHGITMGLGTMLEARKILLLAWGKPKADIVYQALAGPITPKLPASVLQLHPALTVIVDLQAGARL